MTALIAAAIIGALLLHHTLPDANADVKAALLLVGLALAGTALLAALVLTLTGTPFP